MQALDEILIQFGPAGMLALSVLTIAILATAVVLLNRRRTAAIRERDQHADTLRERDRKIEQLERRLEVLGDFTYVSDFRLDRVYTLLTSDRIDVDDESYSHGVVRDEQGRVTPFFTQQSLTHLKPGDTFSRERNELIKLERAAGAGTVGGGSRAFGTAAAEPMPSTRDASLAGGGGGAAPAATMLFRPALDASSFNKDPNSGQPYIRVVRGKNEGALTYVPFGEVTIGRDAANAVQLDDSSSSRVHCRIGYEGNRFILRDNGSTNGTLCNGEPVVEQVLNFADKIQIGDTELMFSCQGYELKDHDSRQAVAAFEDCLEREPNFIGALRVLAYLLERDVTRRREAQPLWDRATRLEKAADKTGARK